LILALPALALGFTAWLGLAEQRKGNAREEVAKQSKAKGNTKAKAAIQKKGEAFVKAFHKADAEALAAFWAPNGEFTDQTGRHLKGRKAIEKAFTQLFSKYKGLKLRTDSLSLRFVTPSVAIEDGTTEVFPQDGGPPTRANYTIVHVKKDGEWLLASVRNSPMTPPSNYEHLGELEFAIGEWAGQTDTGEGERLALAWSDNQTFITGTFSTTARDVLVGSAKQWIGWDPVAKRVRSWIFDATGGFGEGSWTKEGKRWIIKTSMTLQDGKKATATFLLAPVNADTITLQSRDRSVDGDKLPDTKEIKLKRVK
jgi:uncharacterized protein (TIGR02246 family)